MVTKSQPLRRWLLAKAAVPLFLGVVSLFVLEFLFLAAVGWQQRQREMASAQQLAEVAALALNQRNQALFDAGAAIAARQLRARRYYICEKSLNYVTLSPTERQCETDTPWTYRRLEIPLELSAKSPTRGRYFFILEVPLFPEGSLVLWSIGVSLLVCFLAVIFMSGMGRAFQRDLIGPLFTGLVKEEPLPILELEKLRNTVKENSRALARESVAKAILDHNSQIAHDIRSPLTALEIASSEIKGSESVQSLIQGSITRIRQIAEGLLSVRRESIDLETMPISSKRAEVNQLKPLVEDIVREKQIEMRNTFSSDLVCHPLEKDYQAILHPEAFQRILSNIINNAFESISGKGQVVISLEECTNKVLVKVSDTGCGIAPENLSLITQRGYATRKMGGHGLGLSFARETLEFWGGGLLIHSKLGYGTTVEIQLSKG